LNPEVFIPDSNQESPDDIMNQDLNLVKNSIQKLILGCNHKKMLDLTQG